jgi:hypothetical protein
MARKKPKEGRICFVSTFASVDMHVRLVKKIAVPKDSFTDGYICWHAIPMYDIHDDAIYSLEKKKLKEMSVPVDHKPDNQICIVYDWQIKKTL